MADSPQTEGRKSLAAPYTAFSSVTTLIKSLKEHGLPSRIDRSVLTNFSGAVGGQLLTALKFLGLTDDDGHPTDRLRALVAAHGTEEWPEVLAGVLRDAYAPMFQLNMETASPSQFTEAFRRAYPGADEVQRKSMTFFLGGVREAQIKISAYIMRNKKPRSGPAKKRAPKAPPGNGGASTPPMGPPSPPPPPPSHLPGHIHPTNEFQLVALIDPSMSDKERDAVWTLIQFLKMKGAKPAAT